MSRGQEERRSTLNILELNSIRRKTKILGANFLESVFVSQNICAMKAYFLLCYVKHETSPEMCMRIKRNV